MTVTRASFGLALATLIWMVPQRDLAANEQLDRAKELYRSASYDEALGVLDGLSTSARDEALQVHQYRVFCLVALDRRDDAKTAMAALVTADPSYAMSEAEASPRVRTMFAEVRKSLLPAVIQRVYAEAKAAFDRKEPAAQAQFDRVLELLSDPDVKGNSSLADLATVAAGFRDLSKALTPPVAPAAPAAIAETPRPTPVPAPPVLVAPVVLSQSIPVPQIREQREWSGEVEVTINGEGRVVSARMTRPIHPVYDQQLLRAAIGWSYRPALRDGRPVTYTKLITINVDTRPPCTGRANESCRQPGTE